MTRGQSAEYRTLIVTQSETVVTLDGRAGLLLSTTDEASQKQENIVFDVDLERIAGLRQALTIAEQHIRLSQNPSRN
jgi:hypothetical protein